MILNEKKCTKCGTVKALELFYKSKQLSSGRHSWCKACAVAREMERYRQDPDKFRAKARASYHKNHANRRANMNAYRKKFRRQIADQRLLWSYGITGEKYEAMYRAQNGACAICRKSNIDGKRMAVDHDHVKKTVRGLLCSRCNLLLGQANDNIEILYRAADYLESPAKVCGGYL